MAVYRRDAAARLCSITARASTVVPSGSIAIWCGRNCRPNCSTCPTRLQDLIKG